MTEEGFKRVGTAGLIIYPFTPASVVVLLGSQIQNLLLYVVARESKRSLEMTTASNVLK
jgi:hypothetical protein